MITTVLCYSATSGSFVADCGKPCRLDMGNVGLDIVGTLDRRLREEGIRLCAEVQNHHTSLRSAMFAVAFAIVPDNSPAISRICESVDSSMPRVGLGDTYRDRLVALIKKHLNGYDLSYGQLYLLLKLALATKMTGIIVPFLTHAIKVHWRQAPYHLALDLMDGAASCYSASETDKAALIQTIESLPPTEDIFLSTSIVDALQRLGALDQSEVEHYSWVCEQVKTCLANPNDGSNCSQAYYIYSSQFDHPLLGAYCEAVAALASNERKQLLTMAATGARHASLFLGNLIGELATYGDPEVGEWFARFAELPPIESFDITSAVDTFVTAHVALAKLGCLLPTSREAIGSPSGKTLAACGAILYWVNRDDLDEVTKRSRCSEALAVLRRYQHSAALEALRICEDSGWLRHFPEKLPAGHSIVAYFSAEVSELCRNALNQPKKLIGYFRHFNMKKTLRYAISILADHGKNTDLSLLRIYLDDRHLGTPAIEAMKRIEERFTGMRN